MKKIITLFLLLLSIAVHAKIQKQVSFFHLSDVRLLDSEFKIAQDNNIRYLLTMEADRLLAPFLREAGLQTKAESYTNWENTGLDGHIGGHYISALALMAASTGNVEIIARLNYMIDELKRCQDANGNGYIGGVPDGKVIWEEIAAGNIRAGGFDLNRKWVPLYNIHKTYAGLRDAWLFAKNEKAREMLIKMTDWAIQLVSQLSDEQIQNMLVSEHGGLNETFADVYAITGNEKYLHLARQFSHKTILNPLLQNEDRLTGLHANTQIPKAIGYKRIAGLDGNDEWAKAAEFFWNTIIENRSISIGGNSAYEHFNPVDDFSRMFRGTEGPETCNTYNMLRLAGMLYETSLNSKYMNYYERALYNHILSSQHPENGGLVYFTQMRPGHYRVYSQPHTSMWCCVGSGIENHSRYGEMIYAHAKNDLFVNLFIPSRLFWKEKNVEIMQENRFPDEAKTKLTVNPQRRANFTLHLRQPEWVINGELTVTLNGKKINPNKNIDGYVSIKRNWRRGDIVEMEMPMHISVEQMPDNSNFYSFLYGPVVLAAKTGTYDMRGLYADDSRMGHVAQGHVIPLMEMPMIVSEKDKIIGCVSKQTVLNQLNFKLSNIYPDDKWRDMELIPFYRLHDSRYIIYFQHATPENFLEIRQNIERLEQERIRLDAITVSKVECGQQQPESDHFIEMENSRTGFEEGVHWREARGWFSYKLPNNNKKAKYLYFSHFDMDANRRFNVFINEQNIASLSLNGGNRDKIFEAFFPIPDNIQNEEVLTVRFAGGQNSQTAKIIEVRLLEDKPN